MAREYHYWIVAVERESNKPYLIYGGLTEDAARQKGMEMLGGIDFDLKRLPTRDMSRASALLRGSRLETTHSLKTASQRLGHEKSVERLRRKRQKAVRKAMPIPQSW